MAIINHFYLLTNSACCALAGSLVASNSFASDNLYAESIGCTSDDFAISLQLAARSVFVGSLLLVGLSLSTLLSLF